MSFSSSRPKSAEIVRPLLGFATLCAGSSVAQAQTTAQTVSQTADADAVPTVTVTGAQDKHLGKIPASPNDIPQSVSIISEKTLEEQGSTRLQDALRNVPGITLNSGEGGAHGDNINLRGVTANDSFFIDGVRDAGAYARDSFDVEQIAVLKGPSAALFGRGSAGGVINLTTKQATLNPVNQATVDLGSNNLYRGTVDVGAPIAPNAALRLNAMGEDSDVSGRDFVHQQRWGFAPSLVFGLGEDTVWSLNYFHQEERNTPDYGIPFLNGTPAPVPRNSFYGLKDDDLTQTNTDLLTARVKHDFSSDLALSDTLRYGSYGFNYKVSAPHFGDNNTDGDGEPPTPDATTPLSQILVLRDRPSSSGSATDLTNQIDLTAKFVTGPFKHSLATGIELERGTSDSVRYTNQIDEIAPVSLLHPDASTPFPGTQTSIDNRPITAFDTIGYYLTDTVDLTQQWSVIGSARFDRFDAKQEDPVGLTRFHRIDTGVSPRGALLYKPIETATFYFSYGKSFDPAVSYLDLAADSASPAPERSKSYEAGIKTQWLDGQLSVNASLFRMELQNVRTSDPTDPTVQQVGGLNERIDGGEIEVSGQITPDWSIIAGVTHLDPQITGGDDPTTIGRMAIGAPHNTANLWTTYDFHDLVYVAGGANYIGREYADAQNTASIPSYVIFNAMASYQLTDQVKLRVNAYNLFDRYYYAGAYFTDPTESHVIPGAGRSVTLGTTVVF